MATEENPHAGIGAAVVLDIGGDIGALVVEMPAQMEDLEVEIIPTGTDQRTDGLAHGHLRPEVHADETERTHVHGPDGEHTHSHDAPPHVAVVARLRPDGSTMHSLVYGELTEGSYDLYVRPDGPIRLTAEVRGGEVTELRWPDWPGAD